MATYPAEHTSAALPPCSLVPFEPRWASLVVRWVRPGRETYWLAPKSRPPLTVSDVLSWQVLGHRAFMLLPQGEDDPVAYGEVNRLSRATGRYWLGHLVVNQERRGEGFGSQLARKLLAYAFERLNASEVSLVVFPGNRQAIACYAAAGMAPDGYEVHEFATAGRAERLMRMAVRREAPSRISS